MSVAFPDVVKGLDSTCARATHRGVNCDAQYKHGSTKDFPDISELRGLMSASVPKATNVAIDRGRMCPGGVITFTTCLAMAMVKAIKPGYRSTRALMIELRRSSLLFHKAP